MTIGMAAGEGNDSAKEGIPWFGTSSPCFQLPLKLDEAAGFPSRRKTAFDISAFADNADPD